MPEPNLTELETRKLLIDRQLAAAGWSLENANLSAEFFLSANSATAQIAETRAAYTTANEFADYLLLGRNGLPLGVLEAKRSSRSPLEGKAQAAGYANSIRARYGVEPFIFLANGPEIYFWDRQDDSGELRYGERRIAGFFTPDDLERLAFQRKYRARELGKLEINSRIINRPYQHEAIRRVTEKLEQAQRKFLLVMATGTGKTRTIIALLDLLFRAKWIQRVLFLADRRELVRQALGEFKEFLPDYTRTRIETGEFDSYASLHVATYPAAMQVYEQLSPGYYDLIIADESHRSIYNRYRAIFERFDALQLGLTATPTDYIDHNTFQLFSCEDGYPTFYYSYKEAVDEGYLVNYRVLDIKTRFQLEGIHAGQLPPELQRQLEEQGLELGEIDFEGSQLEKQVTNTGTNDAIVREFMDKARKDATGTLPAKTILFAMSQTHARELYASFARLYPDLHRRGFAQLIYSGVERAEQLLDDFKRRDMPRVAISVDMLDTGVDIPAIQNLVFAKPVFSRVKFEQMIGRGTRLWTDPQTGQPKNDFVIFDFWSNFEYFNINPDGETVAPTEPLPARLFRLRLEKLALLGEQNHLPEATACITQLQAMLAKIPADNVNVRPHLAELAKLAAVSGWEQPDFEHLSRTIAPLLRFMNGVSLPVMSFEARCERLALATLAVVPPVGEVPFLQEQLTEDLRGLPTSLQEVRAQLPKLQWMTSPAFWDNLDYGRVTDLQTTFAPLMRYRQSQKAQMIRLSLPDEIASRRWIIYGPAGEGAWAETYQEQLEAYVKELAEQLPALEKLRRALPLDDTDLQTISAALNRPDLFISEENLQKVYGRSDVATLDFLRHILGLAELPSRETLIDQAFEEFLQTHAHYNARQIYFVRSVRAAVLRRAKLQQADFYRLPFSRIGAVDNLFTPDEIAELLQFANQLAM